MPADLQARECSGLEPFASRAARNPRPLRSKMTRRPTEFRRAALWFRPDPQCQLGVFMSPRFMNNAG